MTAETPKPPLGDDLLLSDGDATSRVLICSIYEDQRPLKGTAGVLDWRLRGFLSRFLKGGRINGKRNELVYIPFEHHGTMRHLLLVGLGPVHGDKDLGDKFSTELLTRVSSTVENMSFKRVAISRSSFPFLSDGVIKKSLSKVEVEFTR